MRGIHFDPDAPVINEQFAVVYAPRRNRGRVPENSVTVVASEQAAREDADPKRKLYPARVVGPSRSSEGMRIYYILEWLA
ncbi:MAG: hypothetical protein LJE74_07120 [Proteobacteria bacterium]|jgi:hypothetical protein|nr:hypothetical protein [Pseudomonadota bacterium]MCG6935748.1 hypothetical protein [Pseudomonadota bacterium]